MARPFKYKPNSRLHLGLRFDKDVLELFDKVVRKHGINRLQAFKFLIINAIMEDKIPARHQGIDAKIQELKTQEESPEPKGKLVAGKPSNDKVLLGKGRRQQHLVNK